MRLTCRALASLETLNLQSEREMKDSCESGRDAVTGGGSPVEELGVSTPECVSALVSSDSESTTCIRG